MSCANWADYDAAAEACLSAMKLRPGIPEFHNSLGVIYKDKRDWTAALNQFDQAAKLRPSYVEAIANRANALKELGHTEEALAAYDHALRFGPARPSSTTIAPMHSRISAGWQRPWQATTGRSA